MPGRFRLGVGSGEALNEHIFGDRWPEADVRLEMLEEAVEVIRLLWQGGFQHHHGRHYTLEARAAVLAARRAAADPRLRLRPEGDRARRPDRRRLRDRRARRATRSSDYRAHGGTGPISGGLKVCWGEDRDECVRTVHRMWPNEALSGELAQVLPSPRHFEQATQLVTEEQISEAVACGPDPEEHIAAIQAYVDAGFDEVHVGQIGPDHDGFVDFYAREILPRFASTPAGRAA